MDFSPSILLVDDFENNLDILELYLMRAYKGAKIYKATNGQQALAHFENNVIDIVLLDIMLPDINGFKLCSVMKQARGDDFLPVVMLTALHDKESLLEGLSAGADDFLTKPVNAEELMIRVRNLVNLRLANNEIRRKYMSLSEEMYLARKLLDDFMPKYSPVIEDVKFDMIYEPSSILGGDFFDIFRIDDNHYGFFISDVKGHGVAAAMIVALIKEKLHAIKSKWLKPDKVLSHLNQIMYRFFENIQNDYFMTATYAVFDFNKKELTWSSAGHTPIGYLSQNKFKEIRQVGLPLGIINNLSYASNILNYQKGDSFLFYTDGIFELPLFTKDNQHYSSLMETNYSIMDLHRFMNDLRKNIKVELLKDDINVVSIFIGDNRG